MKISTTKYLVLSWNFDRIVWEYYFYILKYTHALLYAHLILAMLSEKSWNTFCVMFEVLQTSLLRNYFVSVEISINLDE